MEAGNPMVKKPARAHKSAAYRKAKKGSKVRIVGNGFVQRVKKPQVTGKKRKSVMLRVDAEFAAWVREAAKENKSVTAFTRKLVQCRPAIEMLMASIPQPTVETQ
jgi:hypothetical protein